MTAETSLCAAQLRLELNGRNRIYALGKKFVESYGSQPVIVYEPEGELHGNFFDAAWRAICARPEWMRRFDKIHAQGARSLPKPSIDAARRWRELDSSTSSDALLMNVFCMPGVAESHEVRRMLGVEGNGEPEFGWKARVPLKSGRFDRTEVDMRWGGLLVEAKLTETDFQSRKAEIVESYRDFDTVFDRERLPRVAIRLARRREAVELGEDFTQEWEPPAEDDGETARAFQAEIAARADELKPREEGYASYQLIRNVLAAQAQGESFCVIHDARRPDLREAWFEVMAAVRLAELRVRLKVLTWQELAAVLPGELREFLDAKYGIVAS
jgi:hypothetical protein